MALFDGMTREEFRSAMAFVVRKPGGDGRTVMQLLVELARYDARFSKLAAQRELAVILRDVYQVPDALNKAPSSILLDWSGVPPVMAPPAPAPAAAPRRRFALDDDIDAGPEPPVALADYTLHMCIICGTFWRLSDRYGGGWSLHFPSATAGACCDNRPMGDQIVRVYFTPTPPADNALSFERVNEAMRRITIQPGTYNSIVRADVPEVLGRFEITREQIEQSVKAPPGATWQAAIARERAAVLQDTRYQPSPDPAQELPMLEALGAPTDTMELAEQYERLTGEKIEPGTLEQLGATPKQSGAMFRQLIDYLTGKTRQPLRAPQWLDYYGFPSDEPRKP
jgi:hypothetical protein